MVINLTYCVRDFCLIYGYFGGSFDADEGVNLELVTIYITHVRSVTLG